MMRVRIFALLMLGAVMALIAGVATFSYTRSMESELMSAQAAIQAFGATKRVPVAIFDIPRGAAVKPEHFATILLPQDQMPSNVMEDLPQFDEVTPVYALSDLRAGALMLQSSLGAPAAGGLADLLRSPDGRAVMVRPQNFADFQERLAEGDLLDLFWTRDIGGGSSETRLIGNALRLAALPSPPAQGASNLASMDDQILLEVGLRDAARILDAGQNGTFYILPSRGPVRAGADIIEVSDQELASLPLATRLGEAPTSAPRASPEAAQPSPDQRCTAVVVRAGHRAEVQVPC